MNKSDLTDKAKKVVQAQTLENLIQSFELTNEKMELARGRDDEYIAIAITRGWIMDELEARYAPQFVAWLEAGDDSPRKYFS